MHKVSEHEPNPGLQSEPGLSSADDVAISDLRGAVLDCGLPSFMLALRKSLGAGNPWQGPHVLAKATAGLKDPSRLMIRLFSGLPVELGAALRLLGHERVARWQSIGFLKDAMPRELPLSLQTRGLAVAPFGEILIVSELPLGHPYALRRVPAVHLHRDTIFFAERLAGLRETAILDIGTGCGLLAIVGAMMGATVTAIDISPIATAFAKFNAKLNLVDAKMRVSCADFFVCDPMRASIAISNTPFLALPSTEEACAIGYGGKLGTEFALAVLQGLRQKVAGCSRALIMTGGLSAQGQPLALPSLRSVAASQNMSMQATVVDHVNLTQYVAIAQKHVVSGNVDRGDLRVHCEALGADGFVALLLDVSLDRESSGVDLGSAVSRLGSFVGALRQQTRSRPGSTPKVA